VRLEDRIEDVEERVVDDTVAEGSRPDLPALRIADPEAVVGQLAGATEADVMLTWVGSVRCGKRSRDSARLAIDHEQVGAGWSVRLSPPLLPVLQGPAVEPVVRGEGRL